MNDFLAWLGLAWSWFWDQIGGWTGLLVFIGGTALLSVFFAHMFAWIHTWRTRKRIGSNAPLQEPELSQHRIGLSEAYNNHGTRTLPPSLFPDWYDAREQAAGYLATIQSDAKYKTEEKGES